MKNLVVILIFITISGAFADDDIVVSSPGNCPVGYDAVELVSSYQCRLFGISPEKCLPNADNDVVVSSPGGCQKGFDAVEIEDRVVCRLHGVPAEKCPPEDISYVLVENPADCPSNLGKVLEMTEPNGFASSVTNSCPSGYDMFGQVDFIPSAATVSKGIVGGVSCSP
ncbi:MAG: hypothetical protein LBL21_01685 [Rickettsiales bacterium]|nr:hypothetical protein [Rickettsiales bacterium]